MYLHRFVVLVIADQHDVIRYIGFLQVFHRNVPVSVNVERNQIHFTPYNAVHDVMYLLVKHDVSAFQQRVHRIPYDTQSSVAFGDQCRLHDPTIDWLYWSANSGTRPATASMSYIGICWRSIKRSVRNLKTLSTVTSVTFFSKVFSPFGYSGFDRDFWSFGKQNFSFSSQQPNRIYIVIMREISIDFLRRYH